MSIRPARFSRARLSRPALTRAAVGAGLAAALFVGAAAPAAAQPTGSDAAGLPDIPPGVIQAIPGMPDLSPIMPSLPESTGEVANLGRVDATVPFLGTLYSADLNKQVVAGQRVLPGGLVTVRLEAKGVSGHTFVRELRNVMPAGFELVSVMRMKSNALGEAAHILSEEEYEVIDRGADLREVKVAWSEEGFLGLYQDNPRIQKDQTVVVDFVYRAPFEAGTYDHGGVLKASTVAGIWPTAVDAPAAGVPIEVGLAPENIFGSIEGYGVGSI